MAYLASKELLKRLEHAKKLLDKGNVTSISVIGMKAFHDNCYGTILVESGAVHKTEDGTYQWNDMDLNLTNAEKIHEMYTKRRSNRPKRKKKAEVKPKRQYNRSKKPPPKPLETMEDAIGDETLKKINAILQSGKLSDQEIMHSLNELQHDMTNVKAFLFDMNMAFRQIIKEGTASIVSNQL